ncbi:MAG: hypothetical protein WDA42_00820 [Candidatus Bathyarchaeia archaeon]
MQNVSISDVRSLQNMVIGEGLKFSKANTKLKKLQKQLGKKVVSFDLLSGYTCPMAHECKAWAVPTEGTRRIQDGPEMCFRCYSASQETLYRQTFNSRLRNTLGVLERPFSKLLLAIPPTADVVRIHASGDFFSWNYFKAWLKIAETHKHLRFYCYTKMVPFLIRAKTIPDNLRITVSLGSKADHLVDKAKQLGFHTARVVQSENEAAERGLPIDINDYFAYESTRDFALVIHGMQPAKVA